MVTFRKTRLDARKPRSTTLRVSVLLACVACGTAGAAEDGKDANEFMDMELEQLMQLNIDSVYGASKHEQRVTQAPSAISIITSDEIRKFGHRTLPEVLRSVRGLYVSDDRNYTYVGMRGFHRPNDYNTRVLLLIDGHRMNDNVYDSGAIGREGMIDVDLIERIEIIRGPSSSIYGSSAFLGVINVITKHGGDFQGAQIAGDAGTLDTYEARMTYGTRTDTGLEWLISASHYTSDGEDSLYYPEFDQRISEDPRASNDGVALAADGEDAFKFFTDLRYGHWTMSAFLSGRTKEVPTASFETVFNDGRESTDDDRRFLDVKYDRALNDSLTLQARAFYDYSEYSGVYPYEYEDEEGTSEVVLSMDHTVGEWVGTEWQLTSQLFGRHRFIVGAEYRENLRQAQYVYDDAEPRIYDLYDERSSRALGVFAQADVALLDTLTLTAGIRYDRYSITSDDVITPRVALIFGPTSRSAVKLIFGEAFRAPNPYEAYYSAEQLSRPVLDAEKVQTYELVYEQYLGSHYRASVSAYHYTVQELISQAATEEGVTYFDNLDAAKADGLEFEFEGKFDSGALFRASYALQRAEDGSTGRELSSSPRQLGKLNFSVPLYKDRLFSSVEVQYQSGVRSMREIPIDGFFVTNLSLFNAHVIKGLELSLSLYNAFDAKNGYEGGADHLQNMIPQDGRTVRGKFAYRF